jgi:hypothetical protein
MADTKQFQEEKFNILAAMVDSVWQVGEEAIGNPELKISFTGKAQWFLEYMARKAAD